MVCRYAWMTNPTLLLIMQYTFFFTIPFCHAYMTNPPCHACMANPPLPYMYSKPSFAMHAWQILHCHASMQWQTLGHAWMTHPLTKPTLPCMHGKPSDKPSFVMRAWQTLLCHACKTNPHLPCMHDKYLSGMYDITLLILGLLIFDSEVCHNI